VKSLHLRVAASALALLLPLRVAAQTAEPAPAAPGPGVTVRVEAPACTRVPFDRARLFELLRVELRPLGVTEVAGEDAQAKTEPAPVLDAADAAVVLVSPFACNETEELVITIADRATLKTVTRRLRVSDVDLAGRPRVLAIAIAELLGASWVEYALGGGSVAPASVPEDAQRVLASKLVPAVSAQSAPVVSHAPVEPRPRVERGDSQRPRFWTVDGAAMVRLFPARSTAIAGGALGASRTVAAGVRLHASVEAAFGDAHVRMGRVAVNAVTGSLGVGFFTAGPLELEVEPHVALGAGWATGHADDTETVTSHTYTDFLGIGAISGTLRAAAERLSPFATLELGYTFHGVSFLADEERAAGLASVVFGARVGCGWAP
jgi:hypothetical protein